MSRKHLYFPWSPGHFGIFQPTLHSPSFYLGFFHGSITLIHHHHCLLFFYTTTNMTSLAPRNRLRKNDPKPLHSRWGDVSISTPTEGSWCQYNNPHQSTQRHEGYGPGYVPEGAPRVLSRPKLPRNKDNYHTYGGYQVEGGSAASSSSSLSSSRSTSPSFAGNGKGKGALNPRRLSMRLGLTKDADAGDQQPANVRPEFAYKPIKHDYSSDMASRSASRFHYISSSPRHFNEVESNERPRFLPGSSNDYLHCYAGDGRGSPQQQQNASADKNRYSTKRLTMAMVPDADDMYG